jgi:hypothetical protein
MGVMMSNNPMGWTSWANSFNLHPLISLFLSLNKIGGHIIIQGRDTRGLTMRDTGDRKTYTYPGDKGHGELI